MVDYAFDGEQELLRSVVRQFCESEIAPRAALLAKSIEIPKPIIESLRGMGLLAPCLPPDLGGPGLDPVSAGIVAEEIGAADATLGIPVLYLVDASWSYFAWKHGSTKLREEVLRPVARGETLVGIATTEPDVGSDIAGTRMTMVRERDGYRVEGEKQYISMIREVDRHGGGFVCLGRDESASGLTAFYLPWSPDFEVSYLEGMGRHSCSWGGFKVPATKIDASMVIGIPGQGMRIVHEGYEFARCLVALACVGAARRAERDGIEYLKARKAFGKPLAQFPALQFELAEHHAKIEAARQLAYRALWMFEQEQRSGRFSRLEVSQAVAEAKMLAPEWAFDAVNASVQWQGAYGYTKDCPEESILRAVRSYKLAEGSTEIMKLIVARRLLGKEHTKP